MGWKEKWIGHKVLQSLPKIELENQENSLGHHFGEIQCNLHQMGNKADEGISRPGNGCTQKPVAKQMAQLQGPSKFTHE